MTLAYQWTSAAWVAVDAVAFVVAAAAGQWPSEPLVDSTSDDTGTVDRRAVRVVALSLSCTGTQQERQVLVEGVVPDAQSHGSAVAVGECSTLCGTFDRDSLDTDLLARPQKWCVER